MINPSGGATASFGAAGVASRAEFNTAVEFETVHGEIHFDGLDFFQKVFVDDIFVTFYLINFIGLFRLIQSHSQAGAASPAFVKKNSDRRNFLAFEVLGNLFSSCRCYLNHVILLEFV